MDLDAASLQSRTENSPPAFVLAPGSKPSNTEICHARIHDHPANRPKVGDLQDPFMRPSGLEPPRGNLPTGPSDDPEIHTVRSDIAEIDTAQRAPAGSPRVCGPRPRCAVGSAQQRPLLDVSLSQFSDRLPLAPCREAPGVIVLGDTQRCRAEEHP